MAANITQRHHVTTTHGKEMEGQRELIYVKRGFSHFVTIFIWLYLDAFTILYM